MESLYTGYDYTLMASVLFLSFAFGMYQALFKKQDNRNEYLFGGQNLNFLVVSFSIVSCGIYGISLMHIPTNVYYFGVNYISNIFNYISIALMSYHSIVPVFFKLKITSIYEYLELRFNKKVQLLCSFLYIAQVLLLLSLVLYTIGMAISRVSDINFHVITPVISTVCIIYTVFGGIRAVIWTNALQYFIVLISTLILISLGLSDVDGFSKVFDVALKTNRLDVDFDVDPTKPETFWTVSVGGHFQLLGFFVLSQGIMQRFLCLRTYDEVKKTHFVSIAATSVLIILSILFGLIIVAKHVYCDSTSMNNNDKPYEILLHFIMHAGNSYPGVKGIFTAAILSSCLSILSTILNGVSTTICNDFLKSILPEKIINKNEITYLKTVVFTIGISSTLLVYIFKYTENFVSVSTSFIDIIIGPITGIFLVGLFLPNVNAKGALWGGLSSLTAMLWISMSSEWYKMNKTLNHAVLPTYTNSCQVPIASKYMFSAVNTNQEDTTPLLYKLSHYYHPICGMLMVIVVSSVVSHLAKTNEHIDGKYLSPTVHQLRRKFCKKSSDGDNVEQALTTPESYENDVIKD